METRAALDRAIADDTEAMTLRESLRALRAEADLARDALEVVRARHRREEADVERLGGLGWSTLTSVLRRTHRADVAREQAEEAAARAELKGALGRLHAVEAKAEEADRRLAVLGDTATRREDAAMAHAHALVAAGTPEGAELAAILAGIEGADAEVAELERLRAAGSRAAVALDAAQRDLGSASTWSVVDALGGDLPAGLARDVKVSGASHWIVRAQEAFFEFAAAVRDPGPMTRLHSAIDMGGLKGAAEVVLDDPLSDWTMHRTIQDSAERVGAATTFVREALAHTLQRQAGVETHRAELAARRDALLSPRA